MYRPKRNVKRIPELQWAHPDRIFFACGACHILASVVSGASFFPIRQ